MGFDPLHFLLFKISGGHLLDSPVGIELLSAVRHVDAQPGDKLGEAELVGLVEGRDKGIRFFRAGRKTRTVDGEKRIRGGEGRFFVAVDKGMVLREALPEGGGLLDQVGVITGLRAIEGGYEPMTCARGVAFLRFSSKSAKASSTSA